jgi:hypothetical protein
MRYNLKSMKRLLRILLNAATVLSLVLCVATLVLWVRSAGAEKMLHWRGDDKHSAWIASSQGQLAFLYITLSGNSSFYRSPGDMTLFLQQTEPSKLTGNFWLDPSRSNQREMIWAGIGFRTLTDTTPTASTRAKMLFAPHWLIFALTMVLPAVQLTRWLIRQRLRPETFSCPACGYDLRATPDRCPECGTIPSR